MQEHNKGLDTAALAGAVRPYASLPDLWRPD